MHIIWGAEGSGTSPLEVRHFCALVMKKVVTKFFEIDKTLISKSLKGLKSRGIGWLLRERTEGTGEFSREFGGLKAGKSEFKGRKVLNFLENLRGGLRQTPETSMNTTTLVPAN